MASNPADLFKSNSGPLPGLAFARVETGAVLEFEPTPAPRVGPKQPSATNKNDKADWLAIVAPATPFNLPTEALVKAQATDNRSEFDKSLGDMLHGSMASVRDRIVALVVELGGTEDDGGREYERLRSRFSAVSQPVSMTDSPDLKAVRKVRTVELSVPPVIRKYGGKRQDGDIYQFLIDHYPYAHDRPPLTLPELRSIDERAHRAMYDQHNASDRPPSDFLPTREAIGDACLAAHGIDLTNREGAAEARRVFNVLTARLGLKSHYERT